MCQKAPRATGALPIPICDKPAAFHITQQNLQALFDHHLGSSHRCLVHVDEHHMMWDQFEHCTRLSDHDRERGARFRWGAFAALSACSDVVATYTQPPVSLPPKGSSETVCRYPVALPGLDVDTAAEALFPAAYASLRDDPALVNDRVLQRQWATLRFLLGAKLKDLGLNTLHHTLHHGARGRPRTAQFLKDFQEGASGTDIQTALEKCLKLCWVDWPGWGASDPRAAEALVVMQHHVLEFAGKCE